MWCFCAVACAALTHAELASDAASARDVLGRVYPDVRSALVEARQTGYDVLVNLYVLRAYGLAIEMPDVSPEFLGEAYFDLLRRGLAATGRRNLRSAPPGKGQVLVEPWPGSPDATEAILDSGALGKPVAGLERLAPGEYRAVFGVGLAAVIASADGEDRGALAPVELAFRFESKEEPSKLEQEFADARKEGMEGAFRFCRSRTRTDHRSFALAGLVACAILLAAHLSRRGRKS